MAIYHLSFNILQRSQGKSSCAEAAYQARCKIKDQRTGKTFDYRHRTGLYHHLILSPYIITTFCACSYHRKYFCPVE
ncbi:MobA/MobL family protein [Raoultella ornithinolytica]|uniref:MobA/MobL family protein n=1 Tax=Raoultella ornithinolytica TaxID=54291 RepID=UPI003AFB656F